MAKKNILVDLDLNKNEVQNAVVQNLAASPGSPKAGQIWYNTTDNLIYFYNGTSSIPVGYLPPATSQTLGGVKIGTNVNVASDGTISVNTATNAVAGIIRIATDAEVSTGTSESVAVNPKQLASSITTALVGALVYKGTWQITTSTSDFSGIQLPVKQGWMYAVTGTGPATVGGIEWNVGDYIVMDADVAAGGTITQVHKIDNTEASDIVRLAASQTLTNKTIDADDNTIQDLTTTNFKSGTVVTTVGPASGSGAATDTQLATALATRTAINTATTGMVTLTGTQTLTNKTIDADDNTIQDLTLSNFKSGVVQNAVRASSSASDSCVATEKAVATAVEALPHKITATNTSLTVSSGVCTWEITNTLNTADCIATVREASTGYEVFCDINYSASKITIKINSTANIAAGTYTAVIIG